MAPKELNGKLQAHKSWVDNPGRGTKADLRGADLRNVNLEAADLRWADLRAADLTGANLAKADMRHADLRGANLTNAVCIGTMFVNARLDGANMTGVDLRGASMEYAQMGGVNLQGYQRARPKDGHSVMGYPLDGQDQQQAAGNDQSQDRTRGR